ncbi:ComEC/Rec2 family competence protein [uncultured Clostridium sp.]|uniref:ComEC/Rec2 family competence protein n=1 Tax=uncultured Clostridium sp. TaxID=59620 RepID=UPI0026144203|nr:ComEC/Rec2 family competence protein [uncultured Clostridium sp.]
MKYIEKLEFKNPIIDILVASLLGILIYVAYEKVQFGAVIFTVPIIVLFFFIYDRKCFIIVILFMIIGLCASVSYYNFGVNRADIFTVRIEKSYDDYYIASHRGREFYLYSNKPLDVHTKVSFSGKFKEEISMERNNNGHLFLKKLIKEDKDFVYYLRNISVRYYQYIKEKIGESKGAIATALIFGNKDYIEDGMKEDFKDVGILHLICISGFHIVFLYAMLKKILNEKIAIPITFIYVIITGLTASGMRAFTMLIILELAVKVNKNYSSITALGLSAIPLILIKPAYIFDLGFLLSYFATLGIFLFSERFQYAFRRLPEFISKSISLSFSAQVFVYPILIIYFGEFSMNFLLGSLFLTPVIYIALPFGILSVILFLLKISFVFLNSILKFLFGVFEVILEYLKYYSIKSYYCDDIYAVIYLLIFMVFYLMYKGHLSRVYIKINYMLLGLLILSQFSFFTTVSVYEKNFSKAIIIRSGFSRIAYTNSDSDYFIKALAKEYRVSEIVPVNKNKLVYGNGEMKIIIKGDIDESFIMLRGQNCGIIDLLNNDEKAILIKDRIYIDERGI